MHFIGYLNSNKPDQTYSFISYVDIKTFLSQLNFSPLQVTEALAQSGLESSNLILGIDFTKSNEWTGYILLSRFLKFVGVSYLINFLD